MPMSDASLPAETGQIAAGRAHASRQLDLVLQERAPVAEMRRLIADLDRISADLAAVLGTDNAPALCPRR
jgi:hypothetical protein